MDTFLEIYNFPRADHKIIENLNRQIMSKDTESIIKPLPQIKASGPHGFMSELYQTSKDELIPILLKLCQITEEKGIVLNSFYKASII